MKNHLHENGEAAVSSHLGAVFSGADVAAEQQPPLDDSVYRAFFESRSHGSCVVEVLFDEIGRGIDYRFLLVNEAFKEHSGLVDVLGKTIRELVPTLESEWPAAYGRVAMTGEPERFVAEAEAMDRWFEVDAFRVGEPSLRRVALLFSDATLRMRNELSLRESQSLLRSTMDNSLAIIVYKDLDGHYLDVNQALEEALGKSKEEIIGLTDFDLLPEAEARAFRDHDQQVIADGKPSQDQVRQYAGRRRDLLVNSFPLTDVFGRVIGVGHIANDITEFKRAESALRRSEERFRVAMSNAAVLAAQTDRELRYTWVYCPPGSGFEAAIMLGKRDDELSGSQHALQVVRLKQQVLESGEGQRTEVLYENERVVKFFDLVVEPLLDPDGEVVGVTTAASDITERKRTEGALRCAIEQLREADQSKDEFLAMLAHELRNPLAGLSLAARLLANKHLDPAVAAEQHQVCERQIATLSRLVDDLLDVSRITRGIVQLQLQLGRVALEPVVHRAVEAVRTLIKERHHELTITQSDAPIIVTGDELRLEQVMINLLTNAAKYTDPGGRVGVVMKRVEGHAELRVTDSGIGVEPQILDHIFKLFGQGQRGLARSQGGLGIGLTVARHLVEMHGGRIEVRSPGAGQGAEFVVTLPLAQERRADSAPPVPPVGIAATASKRILIVDDNLDVANSLSMLLEFSGHCVSAVHDGPSALTRAAEFRPHLVLLDIGLPGMDGYEVARRLRQLPPMRNAVLAALTGYGGRKDQELAIAAGFDKHFVKPVDIDQLEAFIASV